MLVAFLLEKYGMKEPMTEHPADGHQQEVQAALP